MDFVKRPPFNKIRSSFSSRLQFWSACWSGYPIIVPLKKVHLFCAFYSPNRPINGKVCTRTKPE